MAKIYILKHQKEDFTGFFGGLDFSNGIGSTSSKFDRDFLIENHGCKDITEEFRAKKKKEEEAKKKAEAQKAKKAEAAKKKTGGGSSSKTKK